jgi:hypothetical protein
MAGILSCILMRSSPPTPCEIDATAARAVGSIFALGRTVTRKVITLVSPAASPLGPSKVGVARYAFTVTDSHPSAGLPAHPSTHGPSRRFAATRNTSGVGGTLLVHRGTDAIDDPEQTSETRILGFRLFQD